MTKILAIGATTSTHSLNRIFAGYAATQISNAQVELLDLNDFQAPLYSVNQEAAQGMPQTVQHFVQKIQSADGVVISLAEHNGSYTAAFKSLLDWGTRHKQKVWCEKPMLLLSTSSGPRGGASVLASAKKTFPRLGAKLAATFALPSFQHNFTESAGISNPELKTSFEDALLKFTRAL